MSEYEQMRQAEAEREKRRLDAERRRVMLAVKLGAAITGGIILLGFIFGCFYTVEQGERAVVTRFGAAVRVGEPGIHLKAPFIESVDRISVRQDCVEWKVEREKDRTVDRRMETYSKDRQVAHLTTKVCYRVNPAPKAVLLVYSQFKDTSAYEAGVIVPTANKAVKEIFGLFNAQRVIEDRASFNVDVEKRMLSEVRALQAGEAVVIDNVVIQDIAFSSAYVQAVEERMKAEVEVAKIAQNLERERKQAEILVVQAKARADSSLAEAKAAAEAVRVRGEADASAIRAKGAALRDNPSLVSLVTAEKWNGALPTTMPPNATVPLITVR